MARKRRELTISEELELQWNDGVFSDETEKHLRLDFEDGWRDLTRRLLIAGHTTLKFDPKELIL